MAFDTAFSDLDGSQRGAGGEEAPKFGVDFHTRVEEISHKKFESLSRKGKPESGEWTPLATVVQATNDRVGYGMVT